MTNCLQIQAAATPQFTKIHDPLKLPSAGRIDFDVLHHATLAANWTQAGVTAVDKPLVLGLVGGGVEIPLRLVSELG